MDKEKQLFLAIKAYVPDFIMRQVMGQPTVTLDGWERRAEAAVLFADVSGFTAMSERLAELDKEGAEELTRILNTYFTTMIDLVHRYGGQVIRFGGDAITCSFEAESAGENNEFENKQIGNNPKSKIQNLKSKILLSCACALEMQTQMKKFSAIETKGGTFNLQMKIGLSAGPVLFLSVGNSTIGLEYVLAGQPLDRMAEAEHHAVAGEVVLDGEIGAVLKNAPIYTGESRDGFILIKGLRSDFELPILASSNLQTEISKSHLEKLIPYLPPTIYAQIVDGQRQFVGEHRRIVSLFVYFAGLDYANDPQVGAKLQQYFTTMQEIIHSYGGRLNRVITGDKGSLLHLIFGAPLTHEDNEKRAVGCALAMQQAVGKGIKKMGTSPLPSHFGGGGGGFITDQRIGLASGYVFAGNVGSEQRREYTVMGDVVNLSARLMQAAKPGEILMEQATVRRVETEFKCEALPAIKVKGKREPIAIWRAEGVQTETKSWQGQDRVKRQLLPLVGRETELAQIATISQQVRDGHGQLLTISAEAGVGKSRFLEEIINLARPQGLVGFGGNCLAHGAQSPYLPWLDLFTSFFNLEDSSDEQKITQLDQRLATIAPTLKDWLPLLGQWLGLPIPDNDLTGSLDAQLRKQRLFDLVLTLLRQRARQVPFLLLAFEDVHWIDPISLELLNYVARNIAPYPIWLIALYRPTIELSEWSRYSYHHHLSLTDLAAEDALKLVQSKLKIAELPTALCEQVLRGEQHINPFFVEEVLNALIDQGYIGLKESGEGYEVRGDVSKANLPDSVQALVMSRIDRLDESSKLTVKVASVLGRTFKQRLLQGIYPLDIVTDKLQANLAKLSKLDLTPLDRPAPEWEYFFKHIVTQEVAYESLLYAHRRALHQRVGEYLERRHQDNLAEYYELLAYHYVQSGLADKGQFYLIKAGDKAKAKYANDAAIAYYTQAIQGSGIGGQWSGGGNYESESSSPPPDPRPQVHESLGDIYQLIGQYEQAIAHYQQALEGGYQVVPIRRKIAKTWELQGRYDEALEYLNQTKAMLGDSQSTLEMAHLYNDMGWIATQRGNFNEALPFCFKGLEITEALPADEKSHRVKDELQHTLGSIHLRIGNYAQAINHFQECIKMREKMGNFYGLSRSYNNLAIVYWSQGNYDSAAQYFQNSLEISQKIGNIYMIAMCYNNLGGIYYTQGDYPHAIEHYQKSLEIRQEIGDIPGTADTYNNLGEVSHSLGNYQEARQYLEEAIKMYVEIGSQEALIGAYKLLAEVQLELGNLPQATTYCQQSLVASQEVGDQTYEGIAYRVFGQIHRSMENLEMARLSLQASLDILQATGNKLELGRSYYELGITLKAMESAEWQENLQQAIQIFEALGAAGELAKAKAAVSG